MNMVGDPPEKSGLNMCALPTMLNALTPGHQAADADSFAAGICLAELALAASLLNNQRGFVTSTTTLPEKFPAPASFTALAVPSHRVASMTISPNDAA
jgi:hypothetical protein